MLTGDILTYQKPNILLRHNCVEASTWIPAPSDGTHRAAQAAAARSQRIPRRRTTDGAARAARCSERAAAPARPPQRFPPPSCGSTSLAASCAASTCDCRSPTNCLCRRRACRAERLGLSAPHCHLQRAPVCQQPALLASLHVQTKVKGRQRERDGRGQRREVDSTSRQRWRRRVPLHDLSRGEPRRLHEGRAARACSVPRPLAMLRRLWPVHSRAGSRSQDA